VTLELGIAYSLEERAFLVANPKAHVSGDAPADLRGLDSIRYESYAELGDGLTALLAKEFPQAPAVDPNAYLMDVQAKAVDLLASSDGLTMTATARALNVAVPIAQAAIRRLVGMRLEMRGATRGARYFVRSIRPGA